jgi:subtilisin-like proprotein convertase family protein
MPKLLFILGVLLLLLSNSQAQYNDNQAASFNGTSSHVVVPGTGSDLNPTTALTLEGWIYPTAYSTTSGSGVITKNASTSYFLGFNNTGRVFFYPKGGFGQYLNSRTTTLIQLNTWTHLAATYDGTTTRIFINGVQDTSTTVITGAIGVNTDSLYIGAERSGGSVTSFYNGYMDEVRMWGVARSAAEIARDRSIPLAIIALVPPTSGAYAGLLNAWRMNGTLLDEAGLFQNGGIARSISYWDLRQKPVNYIDYNNTLLLDGVSGYCAARPGTQFDATTAITLEAWIKRDTIGTGQPVEVLVSKSNTSTQSYYLFWNNKVLGFGTNNSFRVASDTILNTNRWYHVAATYSSTTGRSTLYVNGDSVASATTTGVPIQNTPDSVFIGATPVSGSALYKFKGQIDQVRIWKDVVRTRDEIRANMYTGINYTTVPAPANVMVYGFDGRNTSDVYSTGSVPELSFLGTARLTSAHRQINGEQTSPLLRDDAGGFGGPTYVVSRRQFSIPDNTPAGVTDSVFVSAAGTATNVKLFVLLNHTWLSDLTITLTGPTGVSASVMAGQGGSFNDIMAIFDDNADSVAGYGTSFLAPFSPLVKPNSPLGVFAGVPRQGWWKLKMVDGAAADLGVVYGWGVQTSPLVGADETAGLPGKFELLQNYPNPFNPSTTIKFIIPQEADVNVGVYNILGQLVTTLANDRMKAGSYSIQFNAHGFASGTYFYRIQAGSYVDTKKMLLLK